jgi:hypothetical protein
MIVRYWETWYDTSRTLRSTWYRQVEHYSTEINHITICALWMYGFIASE